MRLKEFIACLNRGSKHTATKSLPGLEGSMLFRLHLLLSSLEMAHLHWRIAGESSSVTSIDLVRPWTIGWSAEIDTLYSALKNVVATCKTCRTGFSSANRFHCSDVRSRERSLYFVTDGSERTAVTGQRCSRRRSIRN